MKLPRAQTTKFIRLITLLLFLALLAWFNDSPSETTSVAAPHAAAASTPSASSIHEKFLVGRVVAVADGDTVTVLDAQKQQHRIRLVGIDAPESKQAFGQKSKDQLARWVHGQEVRVEHTKTDRYKRILGKVWIEDRDINLAMVESGMAWYYKQFSKDLSPTDRALYAQAEEAARTKRLGLWADAHPQAPWDFRRQQRQ
jgi:endonuclease YncB( thermonuclease family)